MKKEVVVHERIGQLVHQIGSVKPQAHKPGTHLFTVALVVDVPEYLEREILLRCLPCKVVAGVDTTRLLSVSMAASTEELIAALQSVITDQDPKDICYRSVALGRGKVEAQASVPKKDRPTQAWFTKLVASVKPSVVTAVHSHPMTYAAFRHLIRLGDWKGDTHILMGYRMIKQNHVAATVYAGKKALWWHVDPSFVKGKILLELSKPKDVAGRGPILQEFNLPGWTE